MKDQLWKLLAWFLSNPYVAEWIIKRAQKTPYFHLPGYMNRWWLFNRYSEVDSPDLIAKQYPFLPSIRVHQILREDRADHLHDHPWDARTIILKGWYKELKEDGVAYYRFAGDTQPIMYGEYHHIQEVSEGGCFTLFFTWEYVGSWGFKVDGVKVPYREYLATHPERGDA